MGDLGESPDCSGKAGMKIYADRHGWASAGKMHDVFDDPPNPHDRKTLRRPVIPMNAHDYC
jgi:hypothetical protein